MFRWSFNYAEHEVQSGPAFPDGHKAYRPIINVEIRNADRSALCEAIVDSGADYCTFPLSLLPELGLDKSELKAAKAHGVGGEADVYFKDLQLEIEQVGPLFVYAGFTDKYPHGMLGQRGFFDCFQVTFDRQNKMFHLEAYPYP